MVRKCVVPNCTNTDQKTLCHRFPRKCSQASKWAKALKVENINLDCLINKYTVCCQHFEASAYRNSVSNYLNFTAEPTITPLNPRTEVIETPGSFVLCDETNDDFYPASNVEVQPPTTIDVSENESNSNTVLRPESPSLQNIYTAEEITDSEAIIIPHIWREDISENTYEAAGELHQEDLVGDCFEQYGDLVEVFDCNEEEDKPKNCELGLLDGPAHSPVADEFELETHFERIKEDVADATTQVDLKELEASHEANGKYAHMTKSELITLLEEQEMKIKKQQEELVNFQTAHSYLLRSVDVFKDIMNVS